MSKARLDVPVLPGEEDFSQEHDSRGIAALTLSLTPSSKSANHGARQLNAKIPLDSQDSRSCEVAGGTIVLPNDRGKENLAIMQFYSKSGWSRAPSEASKEMFCQIKCCAILQVRSRNLNADREAVAQTTDRNHCRR